MIVIIVSEHLHKIRIPQRLIRIVKGNSKWPYKIIEKRI